LGCRERTRSAKRYLVRVLGVVQGVGYRPYVYNQAVFFDIRGWVSNQGSALVMDIEGDRYNIKRFLLKVLKSPPSLATVEKVEAVSRQWEGYEDFQIKVSSDSKADIRFIGTDTAPCDGCLEEIFDPGNPRYQYPFTNCTDCGPRYSIIKQLPYDRKNTTMDDFLMCPACQREYNDPSNRRFHAQPNCCPDCGPVLTLLTGEGKDTGSNNPVEDTIKLLSQGKVIAIKGLGGFHLSCDALNEEALGVLRKRKNRPHKPFALMVRDLETAKELCHINPAEERMLLSLKRPIVLLRKRQSAILPDNVAPNSNRLGIMLPYTPLHYLLFQGEISYLVMTSGNRSSAPIEYENHRGVKNLGAIADYFLIHNRSIHIPVEDSVVKAVENNEVVVRRARGYTPFIFSMKAKHEILALGGEQKSTFCLSGHGYGYLSQYLGDLKDYDACATYEKSIEHLTGLLGFKPKITALDLHPGFLSSR